MAETKKMGIYEKLMTVQQNLKAPKNQYNSFGKYKYRSCEDILEGLKPCLKEVKAAVTIDDEIVEVCGRVYVKATAHFRDAETGEEIINTAYAREPENKAGMDQAQITGATSSYARKYALNGLFMIDDTKDADTDESKNESDSRSKKQDATKTKEVEKQIISQAKADAIKQKCINDNLDVNYILTKCQVKAIEELTEKQAYFLASNWEKVLKGEI